jgi:hypothetical protein
MIDCTEFGTAVCGDLPDDADVFKAIMSCVSRELVAKHCCLGPEVRIGVTIVLDRLNRWYRGVVSSLHFRPASKVPARLVIIWVAVKVAAESGHLAASKTRKGLNPHV